MVALFNNYIFYDISFQGLYRYQNMSILKVWKGGIGWENWR